MIFVGKHCFCPCFVMKCVYCIALCLITLIIPYFSHLCAWFTCSSVHTSTLHPLIAHHHLCVMLMIIWFSIYVFVLYVIQLKCHGSIWFMFVSFPFHLLFMILGYIACFSNFLFAFDVLRSMNLWGIALTLDVTSWMAYYVYLYTFLHKSGWATGMHSWYFFADDTVLLL